MILNVENVRPALARRQRAHEVDLHVGQRIRERRIMLGLTQQQFAQRVGITYQQTHKYEVGVNRISAGRLYHVAQALQVEIGYFFENLDTPALSEAPERQRAMLELARSFANQPSRKHQEALCQLARVLVDPRAVTEVEVEAASLTAA